MSEEIPFRPYEEVPQPADEDEATTALNLGMLILKATRDVASAERFTGADGDTMTTANLELQFDDGNAWRITVTRRRDA